MFITARYVCGRVAVPKPPNFLKSGKLSHAKNQDMSVQSYVHTCEERGEPLNEETIAHLRHRDSTAWDYVLDFPIDTDMMLAAIDELRVISKRMRAEKIALPHASASSTSQGRP